GFKLHLVISECSDVLAFTLTPGNVDDRTPVPKLATALFGKPFGEGGPSGRRNTSGNWSVRLSAIRAIMPTLVTCATPS
ncbi:MAG: hypothetical protein IT323_22790, partial [Anaerolineae bacterium]|nr:hypothetical protein [Anaerolineae bacterium]